MKTSIKTTIFAVVALLVGMQLAMSVYGASTAMVMSPNAIASGGFYNSKEVTFIYTGNYTCTPNANTLFGNSMEAANSMKFTNCEVGVAGNTVSSGALPVWVSVPAYAGLSIFGVNSLGATADGYPTFMGNVIVTDCGAGGTMTSCPDHPVYLYSPAFTAVEDHLNITNGIFGLPEGVLPTPAHSHIVDTDASGASIEWYAITVLVFDPNIMPNATTGQCTQVVASNLTNATANCLTSFAALQRALNTSSSAVASANGNNPIWQTLGSPNTQVVVPGDTYVTQLNNDNTNLLLLFAVKDYDFFASAVASTTTALTSSVASTTVASTNYTTSISGTTSPSYGGSTTLWIAVAIVIIIIIIVVIIAAMRMMKKKPAATK